MKKISILIPCFNEEENVVPMSEAVVNILEKELPNYDYELLIMIQKMALGFYCGIFVLKIRR